jgi:heat shock protein HslJ
LDRKLMNKILMLIVLLLAAVACQGHVAVNEIAPAGSNAPPVAEELENATYSGIDENPVTLSNGRWQGEPYVEGGASAPSVGLVGDFLVTGDVDGDGSEEAIVLLWSSSGGSGIYDYIAVMGRDSKGELVNLGTAPLGDRVKVISAEILDGQLIFNVVQAGPGDAACCPGQKVRRVFVFEVGRMMESSSKDIGRLSVADLSGEWLLTHFSRNEKVPEGIEIELHFEENRIGGKAACNRYNGSVSAGEMPGEIRVDGPMAVTRMMCPPSQMEAEQRYLRALESVTQYSFLAGQLVLNWSSEEEMGTFFFRRPFPEYSE